VKLEDQVTSLELSQRLKELGVKQESLWYFIETVSGHMRLELSYYDQEQFEQVLGKVANTISAFAVAELGELLPDFYNSYWCHKNYRTKDGKNYGYGGKHWESVNVSDDRWFNADTEANARAKMLVYLLENNLIPTPLFPIPVFPVMRFPSVGTSPFV